LSFATIALLFVVRAFSHGIPVLERARDELCGDVRNAIEASKPAAAAMGGSHEERRAWHHSSKKDRDRLWRQD
jgi:hypothetical protein